MADEQIRIDITAEDDASKVVDDVADKVEDLERQSPTELEITADADTRDADRKIEDLSDDVKALSRQDSEILLRARIDDAKASLKALRDDLEQTGDKAVDTEQRLDRVGSSGPSLRGNAIADLTGPLGEASSAASDFAGVFDGIGDIAESTAAKVGIESAGMASAIGGIGVAVAGAAALWSYFSERQRKAREEQAKLVEGQRRINEAIRDGNAEAFASEITELYKDAYDAARRAGIPTREFTDYLTGTSDVLPSLEAAYKKWLDVQSGGFGTQEVAKSKLDDLVASMEAARQKYLDANGSIEDQDRALADVRQSFESSMGAVQRNTSAQERAERQTDRLRDSFDRMRGALNFDQALLNLQGAFTRMGDNAQQTVEDTALEVLDLKQSIVDAAETAGATPIEVRTALQKIDAGDLAGARADAESWFARNRPTATVAVKPPSTWELLALKSAMAATIGTIQVPVVAVPRSGNLYQS